MSANRGGRSRLNRNGARRVTERDRRVISVVALHGAASRAQLMALGHFTSVSRANRRLRQLSEASVLRRTYVATGPHQNETIYILGLAGCSIAAEDCNLELLELKRQANRTPERMYLEHHLLVVEARLIAQQSCGDLRLVEFLSEPECRHEYQVVTGLRTRRLLIKPDALALFEKGEDLMPVFIEVDRGHVSLKQMVRSFERYGRYGTDNAFTEAYDLDVPFTVAVATTAGQRRIEHLKALSRSSPVAIKFTTFAELRKQGFDGQIWQSATYSGLGGLWEHVWEGGAA